MGSDREGEQFPAFRDDPEEQAVLWAISLREYPEDATLQQHFRAWLDADAGHRRAWAEMRYVYERVGDVEPAYAARSGRGQVRWPAARGAARGARAWRSVTIMAGCALCLGLLLAPAASLRWQADHRSGVAEVQQVMLADGSMVQLAPQSAIAVDYSAGRRDIRLLKGEAFFSVTPNPQRPFRVLGARTRVTVLGTAFDVREADDDAQASFIGVEHGRVRVASTHGGRTLLTGGQSAAVTLSGKISQQAMPAAQVAAWRARQIIIQDEPVTDAIERLRPWFGGMIVTRGKGLAQQRLTGIFNASDPVEALRGMARAYGGRVTVIGGWLIIYSQD